MWADTLFSQNPGWGFVRTEIEEAVKRKRSDLRRGGQAPLSLRAGQTRLNWRFLTNAVALVRRRGGASEVGPG